MSLCKRYVSANLPKTNSYYESVQKNMSQPIYRKQTGTKFKGDCVKGNQANKKTLHMLNPSKNVVRHHAKPNKMHKHLTQTTKMTLNSIYQVIWAPNRVHRNFGTCIHASRR